MLRGVRDGQVVPIDELIKPAPISRCCVLDHVTASGNRVEPLEHIRGKVRGPRTHSRQLWPVVCRVLRNLEVQTDNSVALLLGNELHEQFGLLVDLLDRGFDHRTV